MNRHRYKNSGLLVEIVVAGSLALAGQVLPAQDNSASQARELENIRSQIRDVESNIQSARNETDQLYQELQGNY